MKLPLLTLSLFTFLAVPFNTYSDSGEQPMTAEERKFYQEQAEKARQRDAYYRRLDIIINEASYRDAAWNDAMVSKNHKWCGETLKDTSLKLESVTRERDAAQAELQRIKAILEQVKP